MIDHAGRSHPAHRCPLCGGHKALRRDAATGHEKSAGRDAEEMCIRDSRCTTQIMKKMIDAMVI